MTINVGDRVRITEQGSAIGDGWVGMEGVVTEAPTGGMHASQVRALFEGTRPDGANDVMNFYWNKNRLEVIKRAEPDRPFVIGDHVRIVGKGYSLSEKWLGMRGVVTQVGVPGLKESMTRATFEGTRPDGIESMSFLWFTKDLQLITSKTDNGR